MQKIILLILLCILLAGCEVFDNIYHGYRDRAAKKKEERMKRILSDIFIDKEMGALDEEMKPLDEEMKPLEWTHQVSQLDNITVVIKTRYIEPKIYYQFYISPYEGKIKEIRENKDLVHFRPLIFEFFDIGGFKILEKKVKLFEMVDIINEKDEIIAIEYKGSAECSEGIYKQIFDSIMNWDF